MATDDAINIGDSRSRCKVIHFVVPDNAGPFRNDAGTPAVIDRGRHRDGVSIFIDNTEVGCVGSSRGDWLRSTRNICRKCAALGCWDRE